MKYQTLSRYLEADFKRLVGVSRSLFAEMVKVVEEAELLKKKSGRPRTLSIKDQTFNAQLLAQLQYAVRTLSKLCNR